MIFLGGLYEQTKDRSSAMDVYKTILEQSPGHYEAKSKLYNLLKTVGKFNKKFEIYKQTLEVKEEEENNEEIFMSSEENEPIKN